MALACLLACLGIVELIDGVVLDTSGFILEMVVLALVVVEVCVEVRLGWVWGTGRDGTGGVQVLV